VISLAIQSGLESSTFTFMLEAQARGAARELRPVRSRGAWIAWGLALQVVGVGIFVTVALLRAKKDGPLESITHYTVRLVWHELLRSRADVALIVLGVVMFVAGAVILARPFVTRRLTLCVAVPVAAAAGVVVLGVIALIVAAVIALGESSDSVGGLLDAISWPTGRDRDSERRK
jgi:hypothetical protein